MAIAELIFILGLFGDGGCQTLRLAGSPSHMPNSGRIEISINETWHEICYENEMTSPNVSDWQWNIDNVIWACQRMGYPGAWLAGRGRFGNGLMQRSVDYLQCQTDNGRVPHCIHGPPRNKSCEPGNAAFAICAVPGYIGCFKDQLPRALPFDMLELKEGMTVSRCIEHCRTSTVAGIPKYAAVQDGRQCFCGMDDTEYYRHGKEPEQDCSQTVCPGDMNQACGGIWKMAVYDITKGFCGPLPQPQNGTRFFGTTYPEFGSAALFQCDDGFVLIGNNMTQCVIGNNPNGVMWSNNAPPVCIDERYLTTTPVPTSKQTSQRGNSGHDDNQRIGSSIFIAALFGAIALAVFILILVAIIVCACLIVRGRKKTRHKQATASNQQHAQVNQGYTHDNSNTNPVTVAVVTNGRQYSSPTRHSNGKPPGGIDVKDNRASPADSGISGLGLVEDNHDNTSQDHTRTLEDEPVDAESLPKNNGEDTTVNPDAETQADKESDEEDVTSYASIDGSTGSRHSKATYTAGSERGSDDESPCDQDDTNNNGDDDGDDDGRDDRDGDGDRDDDDVEINTKLDTRTDRKKVKEIVPDISESGYNSDYFALK